VLGWAFAGYVVAPYVVLPLFTPIVRPTGEGFAALLSVGYSLGMMAGVSVSVGATGGLFVGIACARRLGQCEHKVKSQAAGPWWRDAH